MQDRIVDRPDLQFDRAGVAEFLGQRNLVPGETRLAHIDGEEAGRRRLPAIENAGVGLEGERVLAVSSNKSEATQRMPLPQAPANEPSLLKMRMRASVPATSGGYSAIIWS